MSEHLILLHNVTTDKIVLREMTEQEIAEKKEIEIDAKKIADELEARSNARESASNKLAALGLTKAEIASLTN
jgi:hypothetical protein